MSEPIADLHAHPSNKTFLFEKDLKTRHKNGGAFDPFAMRADLPTIVAGGVQLVVNAIYLPEEGIFDDCFPLKVIKTFAPGRWKNLFKEPRFDRTIELIEAFEAEVAITPGAEMAFSPRDVDRIIAAGEVAFVNSVEGGHSLDADPSNIERLFDRGIAMLTLAHFYANGIAFPVPGVPPDMQFLGCFKDPKDLSKGLTPAGRDVVGEMKRLGMLVDLTHCTPVARREVLDIIAGQRPVVASHSGVHAIKPNPMNPTDEEIQDIADTGGVVGVIFMNQWLSDLHEKNGRDFIVATMKHLRQVGGAGCVGIGTDFDGFTDPPDDHADHSTLPLLREALSGAGFASGEVDLAMGGNVRRVLRDGWVR